MGLKKAAVARLCLNGDIYRAMPDVCAIYLPRALVAPIKASAPVAYASATMTATDEQPYAGGPILLVEDKTGKIRLCNDYDEPGQRCRVWASVEHHASSPKKKAAGRGGVTITAATQPASASAVAETENKEKSQ